MTKLEKSWTNRTPKEFKGKHPDWYWVCVTIPITKKELLKTFGPKCKSFAKDCACCMAWRSWGKNGRVTVTVERKHLIQI